MKRKRERESEPWLSEAVLKARAWLPVRYSLNETDAKLAETAGAGKVSEREKENVVLGVL